VDEEAFALLSQRRHTEEMDQIGVPVNRGRGETDRERERERERERADS